MPEDIGSDRGCLAVVKAVIIAGGFFHRWRVIAVLRVLSVVE